MTVNLEIEEDLEPEIMDAELLKVEYSKEKQEKVFYRKSFLEL